MLRFMSALSLGGLLLFTVPAGAEPVTITSGSLSFDTGDPPSFGFRLAASPFLVNGVIFDAQPGSDSMLSLPPGSAIGCSFVAACKAGDSLSLGITISGTGLGIVGPLADPENPVTRPAAAMFVLTTPRVPLTSREAEFFTLESPFQFSGWFRVFSDDSMSDVLYEATLVGQGTAQAAMVQGSPPFSSGTYFWEESRYSFAEPVPEPGTLALLGVGIVSASVARRRRRRTAAI
jgi:hypothetical protein